MALEQYGLTSEFENGRLSNVLDLAEFATEDLMTKCPILSKLKFEVMNEDEDIQLAKIVDYFSDEELDEHLFSVSVTFRSSFGTRNVPLKAANWDGRPSSADEIRKSRPETDKVDCYRVLLPSGQTIEKQIHSAAVFAHDGQSMYAIQPREIEENNLDPFLKLVPNRRNPNMRLILF